MVLFDFTIWASSCVTPTPAVHLVQPTPPVHNHRPQEWSLASLYLGWFCFIQPFTHPFLSAVWPRSRLISLLIVLEGTQFNGAGIQLLLLRELARNRHIFNCVPEELVLSVCSERTVTVASTFWMKMTSWQSKSKGTATTKHKKREEREDLRALRAFYKS